MNDDVSRFTLLTNDLDMLIQCCILFCMLRSVLISNDCKRAEKQHRAVRWERRMTSIGETRLAWLPLIAQRFSMRRQCDWCDKCDL